MLTYEINQNDLIYYFKGNIARKRFYGFNNGRELFKKIKIRYNIRYKIR